MSAPADIIRLEKVDDVPSGDDTASGRPRNRSPESLRLLRLVNEGIRAEKIISVINGLLDATTMVYQKKDPNVSNKEPRTPFLEVPDHAARHNGVKISLEWLDRLLDRELGKPTEHKQLSLAPIQSTDQKAAALFSSPAAMAAIGDDMKLLLQHVAATPEGRQMIEESLASRGIVNAAGE